MVVGKAMHKGGKMTAVILLAYKVILPLGSIMELGGVFLCAGHDAGYQVFFMHIQFPF